MSQSSDKVTIVNKPWGREIIYAHSEYYLGKVIEITAGHRLSLQSHVEKDETIYVLDGRLELTVGSSPGKAMTSDLDPGQSHRIRPGTVHRFAAPHGAVRLLEVSTSHLDDVVRYSDDYGRVVT